MVIDNTDQPVVVDRNAMGFFLPEQDKCQGSVHSPIFKLVKLSLIRLAICICNGNPWGSADNKLHHKEAVGHARHSG